MVEELVVVELVEKLVEEVAVAAVAVAAKLPTSTTRESPSPLRLPHCALAAWLSRRH